MEINKFPMLIVGVVIALVLAGAVLPVFAETTSATDTFKNDDYFITMDRLDNTSSHTIVWEQTTAGVITVDGIEISPNWESISIVAWDNGLIRCSKYVAGSYYLNILSPQTPSGYGSRLDQRVTITVNEGSVTITGVTSQSTTYTATVSLGDEGYIINPENEGEYNYIMKKPNATVYLLGDSPIYGVGYSTVGGAWQNVFKLSGTVSDGINVDLVSTTLNADPVISDIVVVSNEVNDYVNLYTFDKITFNATYDETVTPLTYSYVVVPSEVTSEKSIHPDGALSAILNILPLLVIAGLVAGSIAWFITRK